MAIYEQDEKIIAGAMDLFDHLKVEDCPNSPIVDANDRLNEPLIRQMEFGIMHEIARLSDRPVKIFENDSLLTRLITCTGGHRKTLYMLIHDAFQYTQELPVSQRAIGKARGDLRYIMSNSVDVKNWSLLANVHLDPHGDYDRLPEYQSLPIWSILKYEDAGAKWHRVHPLLIETASFREAVEVLAS